MPSKRTYAVIAALSAGAVVYALWWTQSQGWSPYAVLAAVFASVFVIAFAGMAWGG